MELSKPPLPFDLGRPGEEREPQEAPFATEKKEGGIPGYVEPWVKCANCKHFDGDDTCQKYNAPADMDGSCPSYEEGGEEQAEMPEMPERVEEDES